ncbi:hypothetical protein TRIUR3_32479 [Triticum urartu]|uniref:Senescence domain-containing protein n=1 Tax=Triticum urartu TaxID=4572 RepID=M7ZFX0_TRIUA|nr:hypothetical protein TRIUR3_32479 [Triticum urartu]
MADGRKKRRWKETEERSRREAEAQDNQGDVKTRSAGGQEGELDSLGKILAEAAPRSPSKSLAGATCPTPAERATLEPTGSNLTNCVGTKAREAPLWWHANLRQAHKHMSSDEDQKTATLGRILAEEIHKTLAGDDSNATTRPLPGPRQDPCRGHQQGHCQARISQDSAAVRMQGRLANERADAEQRMQREREEEEERARVAALPLPQQALEEAALAAYQAAFGDDDDAKGQLGPICKLDAGHYFFSLHVPHSDHPDDKEDAEAETDADREAALSYGLTVAGKGQEQVLEELDRVLKEYTTFSVKQVDEEAGGKSEVMDTRAVSEITPEEAAGDKKEEIEEQSAAFWTTIAPNVDDYSSSVARLIAKGSGQLVRGIIWCGDITATGLKCGEAVLKKGAGANGKHTQVKPSSLKRMKRYGDQAGEITQDYLHATGNALGVAWAVFKIRKALDPKGHIKKSSLASSAAHAVAKQSISLQKKKGRK